MTKTQPAGFFQRKTTWASLIAIIGSVAGVATGTLSIAEAVPVVMNGVIGLTLRDAIAKKPTTIK